MDLIRQLGTLTAGQVTLAVAVAVGLYLAAQKAREVRRQIIKDDVHAEWEGAVGPLEKETTGLAVRLKTVEDRQVWLAERIGGVEKTAQALHERFDGREARK
jgi:hypothetical protein